MPAMHHEAAVFAAPHQLAFDVEPEMRGFVQRRMERPERNHRAALRRLVEVELLSSSKSSGTSFHGNIFAQRMDAFRPAVRQNQTLRIADDPPVRCPPGPEFPFRPIRAPARPREMLSIFGIVAGSSAATLQSRWSASKAKLCATRNLPEKGRSSAPMLMTYRASRSRKTYWQIRLHRRRAQRKRPGVSLAQSARWIAAPNFSFNCWSLFASDHVSFPSPRLHSRALERGSAQPLKWRLISP